MRLAAGFADVRGRLRRPVTIDVEHGDCRALARKAKRDGAPDPGSSAGYDRNVILQKPRHPSHPSYCMKREPT
jgi:hypothetical protein